MSAHFALSARTAVLAFVHIEGLPFLCGCIIMPRRIKRAAAVLAESKIRKAVEESMKKDENSSGVFDFDGVVPRPLKRRATTKEKRDARRLPTSIRRSACEERKRGTNPPENNSVAALLSSSQNSISSSISSSASELRSFIKPEVIVEISTAEKAHMEHRRRRSIRSVNSAGPMLLSYRTSYRISKHESASSPVRSPIFSTRLRFTPVAHLQTTPTVATASRNGKGNPPRGWYHRSYTGLEG